jgi:ubiquinol-cytochrome c reductase cytochrome c1 subunit
MTMTRIFAAALVALGLSGAASALEGDQHAPHQHHWHHDGPFGTFDDHAVQRGYQVYQEVCASCHSMDLMRFRNLGQRGGPFESDMFPNPNDNPIVMQIAAGYMVMDGPNDDGDMFERAGLPSDAFPAPFANEQQARASNGGAYPPDLSLIVKARGDGANYVYSLLTGYEEAPHDSHLAAGQYYNPYFPGGAIAMAPPLSEGIVTYADGTEATVEQMAEDVVTFLTWAGDPHMETRKQMGFMVLLFLFIFAVLVYLAYRQVWANVKH